MRYILSLLALCVVGSVGAFNTAQTIHPPRESRPETWFHFIDGNVSERGIIADLDAIAGAGIAGVQLFHGGQFGGGWPGVSPQIRCLSESWDDLVARFGAEAKARDLRFTMQNCPGWAMSGGPWITPGNAMRQLVTSRTLVKGGTVHPHIPRASGADADWQDYREVCVLAFPLPEGEGEPLKPASVTADRPAYTEKRLTDWLARRANMDIIPRDQVWHSFDFTFREPVTVRTVEFPSITSLNSSWCYAPDVKVRIEAETSQGLRKMAELDLPQGNWQEGPHAFSIACDEQTTSTIRVSVLNGHGISLRCPSFLSAARYENWQGEAGWTLRGQTGRPPARQNVRSWIDPLTVLDLSGKLTAAGELEWTAPDGDWLVLRVGHVNTGAKNGPAPKEATGFECDKLSTRGADVHFKNYIGRLASTGGPIAGRLDAMLMDSWECFRQTWTDGFDAEFKKRCGYELFTWMPALFGYVMQDPLETRRFLRDWRGLISDCIVNRFYGRMAELAHQNGLRVQFETAFGDVVPGDIMAYYKHADIPMCEFWSPTQESGVGSRNFKPIKPTVSAAHLYGKRRVSAEAFTSFELTWNEKLRDLKQVANLHFADGVTHLVFHTYTHNPRTDGLPPGTSFGSRIGTPFLRGQTWWSHMPDFTEYLARCTYLLESGRPVNDVLWYLGDMLDHKPPEDAQFPKGYKADYCNPDALLTRVKVKNGQWTTPEGIAYRMLWIPESRLMLPETLEKIREGVAQGGTVAFVSLPEGLATRRGGEAAKRRFNAARAGLQNDKSGRVIVGLTLKQALARAGVAPDVACRSSVNGIVWNHRADDSADWYFVAADNPCGFVGRLSFRNQGSVELFDPVHGTYAPVEVKAVKGRTVVDLSLEASESRFVVFRQGKAHADRKAFVRFPVMCEDASAYTVISARYGALETEDRWIDAKARLQKALSQGVRSFRITNEMFGGDPAQGTPKAFRAVVKGPDGQERTLAGAEHSVVALPERKRPAPQNMTMQVLSGPWNLKFPVGWGAPENRRIDRLVAWKDLDGTAEAKAFSGTVTYTKTFRVERRAENRTWLDLGRVESLAKVCLNGKDIAHLWCEPYRVEVTGLLREGENTLEIEVTDTWYNRLVYDAGQPEKARRTWTIAGPRPNRSLVSSGLLGPVALYTLSSASDAEKYSSTEMNATQVETSSGEKGGVRVV